MFTVEYEFDEFLVTVVDDSAAYEDVGLIIGDEVVYIRQYDEQNKRYDLIKMTPMMLEELKQSFKKSEGAYFIINK